MPNIGGFLKTVPQSVVGSAASGAIMAFAVPQFVGGRAGVSSSLSMMQRAWLAGATAASCWAGEVLATTVISV